MDIPLLASLLALDFSGWVEPVKSFWQSSDLLGKDKWEQFCFGMRVAVPVLAALALIYEWRARRVGEALSVTLKRRVAIAFTVVGFIAYYDFANPNTRYADYYHRHEFYHYYLGSKYSTEIGYSRLYECTAIAELETSRETKDKAREDSIKARELRDLRVNLIKPITETYVVSAPEECKKHFSPAKWEAFKQDVNWFYKSAAGSYWENMVKDHGYNPPPVWTMTGKILSSFAPASDGFFKILACMDILLQLGAVLLINWAFGWRMMAIATVWWGCNGPANFYWTGGAFMRQDWIFLLVAALCLARKRMFSLAGAALTWSALLRVFPLIMFEGWGIVIGLYAFNRIRRGQVDLGQLAKLNFNSILHKDHQRLIGGCIVAAGLLIPSSMIATQGPEAYEEFFGHTIAVHNNTPLTNHMGLETMLVHDWKGRMRFTRDDNLDDPFVGWKAGRIDRFKERQPYRWAIVLALGLWTTWALRRTKLLWVALALSLPLTMALTNLTCYYYSMFMVAAALAMARKEFAPAFLVVSAVSQIVWERYYFVDDKFAAESWLFGALCILLLFAYSRPFSIARFKAWWDGKPEPRSKPKLEPAPTPAVE